MLSALVATSLSEIGGTAFQEERTDDSKLDDAGVGVSGCNVMWPPHRGQKALGWGVLVVMLRLPSQCS